MAKSNSFSFTNFTRTPLPPYPWAAAARRVLGKNYELSLVFIGRRRARRLNIEHRGKDYPANVLSFALEKNVGEIFLHSRAKENLFYLFIHGLLHLKGLAHGSKMEREENSLGRFFDFNFNEEKRDRRGARYRHRLRSRHR